MVKYMGTKNNLLKLIKNQRHKNVSMYTVGVSSAKSEQSTFLQSITQL